MRKVWGFIGAAIFSFCLLCAGYVRAESSVKISGEKEVLAGKEYTYTVTIRAEGHYAAFASCSGAFELLDSPDISSSAKPVKIKVRVKDSAKPGDTGTLSVKGSGILMDDSGNPVEFDFGGSFKATVIEPAPQPAESAPAAIPSPSPAPDIKPPSSSHRSGESDENRSLMGHIQALKTGESATFYATGPMLIPMDALYLLKQKQGCITLVFDTYTCTIDGAALNALPDDDTRLDISVSLQKDSADAYELQFAHTGALPGTFCYSFLADSHKPGDTLYIYHQDSSKLEYIHSAVVDQSGWVTICIRHFSSYLVTGAPIILDTTIPDNSLSTENDVAQPSLAQNTDSAQTPSFLTLPFLIGALLLTAGVSVFITLSVLNRRQKQ